MLSCQKANSNSHFGLNLEARLLIFRSSTFCGAVLLLYGHKFTCLKDIFIGLHSQREHFLHLEHSSQCSEQYQQPSQLLVWWGPPSPISEQSASSASPSRAVRMKVVPHNADFTVVILDRYNLHHHTLTHFCLVIFRRGLWHMRHALSILTLTVPNNREDPIVTSQKRACM